MNCEHANSAAMKQMPVNISLSFLGCFMHPSTMLRNNWIRNYNACVGNDLTGSECVSLMLSCWTDTQTSAFFLVAQSLVYNFTSAVQKSLYLDHVSNYLTRTKCTLQSLIKQLNCPHYKVSRVSQWRCAQISLSWYHHFFS